VIVRDEFNVRNLAPEDIPGVSFVSMDLSFISATKVLPALKNSLSFAGLSSQGEYQDIPADVVVLVKPQFEVGKGEVGKGGVVRDQAKRAKALESVEEFARHMGFHALGSIPSPVPGAQGNREFLLYLQLSKGLLSLP